LAVEAGVSHERFSGRLEWAGLALGFGLGGFFDGILLHQVLQWHHLLSGIEQARQDIRVLILTDGIFHVLMYVITGLGLWLLWRARDEFSAGGADRRLFANALIGFGVWHVLDGVLSHWVLGIHRIRMDVDNPLFWDLLWFGIFGLVPIVLGWRLRRRGGGEVKRAASSPLALVLAAAVSGPLAALPPSGTSTVAVLFKPGVTPAQAFAAMQAVDGRIVWVDPSQQVWVMDLGGGDAGELYRYGALLISNSTLPLGCFSWTRA
jgi:uncharacterized membrane protein